MANKSYEEGSDYQFQDEAEVAPVSEGDAAEIKSTSRFEKLKNKKLLFVVGLVVLLIIVYNVLPSSSQTNEPAAITVPAQPIVPLAQVKPFISPAPEEIAPVVAPPVAAPSVDADALQHAVTNATRTMSATVRQMINATRAEDETRIAAVEQENDTLRQQASVLSTELAAVQAEVKTLKAQAEKTQAIQEQMARNEGYSFSASGVTPAPTVEPAKTQKIAEGNYVVQAIIPGRAWLRAADGSTFTVSVGDSVPGYGTVTAIDSFKGIVATSSDKAITAEE